MLVPSIRKTIVTFKTKPHPPTQYPHALHQFNPFTHSEELAKEAPVIVRVSMTEGRSRAR